MTAEQIQSQINALRFVAANIKKMEGETSKWYSILVKINKLEVKLRLAKNFEFLAQ